jgi:thiol-disulfide isomerase/thioredoxin
MLLNLWASWCADCRDEMPLLEQLDATKKVDVLGVDGEDSDGAAVSLVKELGVRYPSVFDPENTLAEQVGAFGKPTTLFIDKRGQLVHVQSGAVKSYDDLTSLVDEYLGVSVP